MVAMQTESAGMAAEYHARRVRFGWGFPPAHRIRKFRRSRRARRTLSSCCPTDRPSHVELAKTEAERDFGLMERTSLPQGRGMLFIHDQPGQYPYWMYDCKIGLDILWMDQAHRIVEMSPDTPPCKGKSDTCPNYGGHETSVYVLELPVGSIKAHQLAVGQTVNFNVQ